MTQEDTTTDRLVSIIQLIQLGKRTGVMVVKRGEGRTLEEGMIAFVNGQFTQAQIGRYSGSDAMNRLSAWGTCRFNFTPSDTSEEDTLLAPKSFKEVRSHIGDQRVTGDLSDSGDQRVTGDLSDSGEQSAQRLRHSTGPVTPLPRGDLNYLSHLLSPIPYRRVDIDTALHVLNRKKLTRAHHRLLLLIDGKRSIKDLVRLMGRNEKEVQLLLIGLEQAIIISFHPSPPSE